MILLELSLIDPVFNDKGTEGSNSGLVYHWPLQTKTVVYEDGSTRLQSR